MHLGEALKIRVKTFKQNLHKNCSKSTKTVITACEFSKFSGDMPPHPLEFFLLLNQLQTNFAEKKTFEINVENMAHLLLKFLTTPLGL